MEISEKGSDPFLLVLLVDAGSVADVAAVFYAVWIVMGPVHEATKIIPFVHAAHVYAIAHTERHSFGQVDVVRDQQAATTADVDDDTTDTGKIGFQVHQGAEFGPMKIVIKEIKIKEL